MDEKEREYLKSIYYNTKLAPSFSGPDKLYRYIKKEGEVSIPLKEIRKWIQSQEVHTTNRLVKRKIRRRRVIVPYIDYMWDCDTASFINYKTHNNNFGYFVLVIDVFSRYVWTQAVHTPSGIEVKKMFEKIFKAKRIPQKIRTDKGTEFNNKIVQNLFTNSKIEYFSTENEVKANYAERAIQTLKGRLVRYMRANQTYKWVDQLEATTTSYNNTYHRSIKQTPASVSKKDEDAIWETLYSSKEILLPKKSEFKFNIGAIVRISKLRHTFQRYYSEHWTNELFIIKGREMKDHIPSYTLTDYAKDPISGIFYEAEIQEVYVSEDTVYNIEKVLQKRTRNRKSESLVKWKGWPEKFNTWIPTKDIQDYK